MGQKFSLLLPFVRLEHEENLVSDFVGVLSLLFVFFSIVLGCESITECFDVLPVDQHLLPKDHIVSEYELRRRVRASSQRHKRTLG